MFKIVSQIYDETMPLDFMIEFSAFYNLQQIGRPDGAIIIVDAVFNYKQVAPTELL